MSSIEKTPAVDLADAMANADVLDTFLKLPGEDQDNFTRWVGRARDDASYWRRIDALVLAMRSAILNSGPQEVQEDPGAVG